jgi:hypothetical protein
MVPLFDRLNGQARNQWCPLGSYAPGWFFLRSITRRSLASLNELQPYHTIELFNMTGKDDFRLFLTQTLIEHQIGYCVQQSPQYNPVRVLSDPNLQARDGDPQMPHLWGQFDTWLATRSGPKAMRSNQSSGHLPIKERHESIDLWERAKRQFCIGTISRKPESQTT